MSELNLAWLTSPASLNLTYDDVHVWRADLNQPELLIQRLSGFLAPDELARMDHFHFSKDRGRFAAARGILRVILSYYTGTSPEQIRFIYGSHGKPILDVSQTGNTQSLYFNLSHSGNLVLIALARSRNVGVDVERLRSDVAYSRLARRLFTPTEQAALFRLPPGLRFYAFYAIWTRKEAYLKATGIGLGQPLDGFEVDLTSGQVVDFVSRSQPPGCAEVWSLLELIPGPGYAAALAVAGRDWDLSCWQWCRV